MCPCVRVRGAVLALQEALTAEAWMAPYAEYELGALLLRERATARDGLKTLHRALGYAPDFDFKMKLTLKCHLTMMDASDRGLFD